MLFTEITEKPPRSLEEHLAEVNTWLDEAAPAYTGIDPVVRSRMGMPPASQAEIQNYVDANPPVVRSGSGAPVTTGSGTPVQSGGAVNVVRAADAASPDRSQAMAKPPVSVATTSVPSVSAATTAPVISKPIASAPLPSMTPVAKPVVKPAPTFSKGVTDIAAANKIADPNRINAGQTIKLPTGQNYTVAKGDTLSGIAAGQFKGATTPPASSSAPPVATPPPPAVKPVAPAASAPPAVKPAAPAASAPPVATPPPAVKPNTTTPIKPSDVPGLGPGDVSPKKSPFTGRNPELQASNKPPISAASTLTAPDNTPPTMFNKLPTGSFGATKESSELARIKNLAGLK